MNEKWESWMGASVRVKVKFLTPEEIILVIKIVRFSKFRATIEV